MLWDGAINPSVANDVAYVPPYTHTHTPWYINMNYNIVMSESSCNTI